MEATTAPSRESSTGSRTIADLLPLAAEKHATTSRVRFKRDGEWHDVTFAEVGEIVSEIARGLIDLGIEPGDRVSLLANTRPEWTYCDFAISAAGGWWSPIYPTNSPEECEWVAGNSEARGDRSARTPPRWPRSSEVASELAQPAHDRDRHRRRRATRRRRSRWTQLRERGRGRDPASWQSAPRPSSPDDPFTFIYTSGTTGPPKGCVLTHGNYRDVLDMCERIGVLESGEVVLPVPPAGPRVRAADPAAVVRPAAGRSPTSAATRRQIIPELSETKPTYFPSVPRIFEKIYTL